MAKKRTLREEILEEQMASRSKSMAELGDASGILQSRGIIASGVVERVSLLSSDKDPDTGASRSLRVSFKPEAAAQIPKWDPVCQAKPVKVQGIKSNPIKSLGPGKRVMIFPDAQIGYRFFADGSTDPFHDDAAINVALQICSDVKPDVIVNLGDMLDLPMFGKYEQEMSFMHTVDMTVNSGYELLAHQRAIVPMADIHYLEGNHDRRLLKYVMNNAAAAFGIKRAKAEDEWPVLSIPFLLRFDDLDVNYVAGYPAGVLYLSDNLCCIHGMKHNSRGSTAAMLVDDERVSTIFGHVHRIETKYKTRQAMEDGVNQPKFIFAHTPGCLSRIDGAVPSVKGSIDDFGRPIRRFEDWQQGVSVVSILDDGSYSLESIPIFEGRAMYRDRTYTADLEWALGNNNV